MLRTRGGVPEWPKGSDCKSAGTAFEGSNPSPSTTFLLVTTIFVGLITTTPNYNLKQLAHYSL
jgi:hypothetical protein